MVAYCFILLGLFAFSSSADETSPKRKIQTFLNKDCDGPKCGENGGLGYVVSRGEKDTLHYIVSPIGTPSLVVIKTNTPTSTSVTDTLSFDWSKLDASNLTNLAEAIVFPSSLKVQYSYGLVFARLFQFNDTKDKGDYSYYSSDPSVWTVFDLEKATWENIKDSSYDGVIEMKIMHLNDSSGNTISNGSLSLKFTFFDHMDRAEDLPHLVYNENITHFDLTLDGIDYTNNTNARYVPEVVFFSQHKEKNDMTISKTRSIDDEYSPGVFRMNNWLSQPSKDEGAFMQWKPVCYLKSERSRSVGTLITEHGPSMDLKSLHLDQYVTHSILYAVYEGNMDSVRMSATNFSFGLSKDGAFTKTNYTAWSGSLGYGAPPTDKVSSLAIGVITAGLGIPVILIIFGGLFVFLKKKLGGKKEETEEGKNLLRNNSIQ